MIYIQYQYYLRSKMTFFHCQELNQRALGEVAIREALRDLDLWGASATFQLTEPDTDNKQITLIKEWKDIVNQVR